MTEVLYAGLYYLSDFAGHTTKLDVDGQRLRPASAPDTDAAVTMHNMRFFPTASVLPRAGTLAVSNADADLHFMSLEPVKANATDAEIQRVFNEVLQGKRPTSNPFRNGPSVGLDVLSPDTRSTSPTGCQPAGTCSSASFPTT